MLAYHSDASLKEFVLDQLAVHRAADELIKGIFWKDGKGCAVGCTIEAVIKRGGLTGADSPTHGDHAAYENHLGIPRVLAYLEDGIFERLDNGASQEWPQRFTAAIQPGADLSMVWPRFALWLLSEELPRWTKEGSKQRAALNDVAALYREHIETGKSPDRDRWLTAKKTAAAAAAAYAADYAAAAAAAYAADYAAAAAYAAAEARQAYWIRASDKLTELLASAPV